MVWGFHSISMAGRCLMKETENQAGENIKVYTSFVTSSPELQHPCAQLLIEQEYSVTIPQLERKKVPKLDNMTTSAFRQLPRKATVAMNMHGPNQPLARLLEKFDSIRNLLDRSLHVGRFTLIRTTEPPARRRPLPAHVLDGRKYLPSRKRKSSKGQLIYILCRACASRD
ncbi:hypothetical protein EVAR_80565_1 [Eumeta japonica]|uniref:Uncharacterized protein n=1 Tax=Eumeta variegata TaxID=151549 RepID=A0A4C1TNS1_EUMVA|nr:hypothetical protein EVAR_80565_1 [Eumeta japonica]